MKTHWRTPDKTDFLGACDLDEGKDIVLTIEKVEVKKVKVRGTEGLFRVATFKEKVKPMILNVGNAKIVKKFAKESPHVEDWCNIPVTIFVIDNARLGSETVEALRIRPIQPKLQKKVLTPAMVDLWANAVDAMKNKGKLISDIEKIYDISPTDKTKLQNESIPN